MADYQTYMVRKPFNWNGVELKPGDTWLVDLSSDRRARIESLLQNRFAGGEAPVRAEEAVKSRDLRRQLPRAAVAR